MVCDPGTFETWAAFTFTVVHCPPRESTAPPRFAVSRGSWAARRLKLCWALAGHSPATCTASLVREMGRYSRTRKIQGGTNHREEQSHTQGSSSLSGEASDSSPGHLLICKPPEQRNMPPGSWCWKRLAAPVDNNLSTSHADSNHRTNQSRASSSIAITLQFLWPFGRPFPPPDYQGAEIIWQYEEYPI
jgi:hypothetical protein